MSDVNKVAATLAEHADCEPNTSSSLGAGTTGWDEWSCGIRVPFTDEFDDMQRLHLATALAYLQDGVEPRGLRLIDERIERLEQVAYRWEVPGGSRRLAHRARDKIAGLELARRLVAREGR